MVAEETLLEVWRYLAAEYVACARQGEQGEASLRLLVEALIGVDPPPSPLRIFPVRGSSGLRLHSEHGVPLSHGLSPLLAEQGPSVVRLAERIVPQLDVERLEGVEGLEELLGFLRVSEATPLVLEQQLQICFRFGLATTADPQLWWDSFKYTQTLGHAHGLADFMAGQAVALPVTDGRVVSSRDTRRLGTSLPCLLGLRRKHSLGTKHTIALPPSANATWSARVRWELAMVQAFGITFPPADAERAAVSIGPELLQAIADARKDGEAGALKALAELLSIYQRRLGALLPKLKDAMQESSVPEACLLEARQPRVLIRQGAPLRRIVLAGVHRRAARVHGPHAGRRRLPRHAPYARAGARHAAAARRRQRDGARYC